MNALIYTNLSFEICSSKYCLVHTSEYNASPAYKEKPVNNIIRELSLFYLRIIRHIAINTTCGQNSAFMKQVARLKVR
jgi:hypothetical protein